MPVIVVNWVMWWIWSSMNAGDIEAIIIPKGGKFCGLFGAGAEYIIPFKCIKRIGPDIILVEMHEET